MNKVYITECKGEIMEGNTLFDGCETLIKYMTTQKGELTTTTTPKL